MQRKAYVPGLAALLVAFVAGCTADTATDGSATDSKAGGAKASAAAPGKYRTLREPCGSVERSTLKDLLPGATELPEDQRQQVYRGTASVTYDTDRRVGCRWKADAPDASHRLTVDFERVVSYDTAVSDDDRAQEVFAKKQAAAALPVPADPRDEKGQESSTGTPSPTTATTPKTPTTPTTPTTAPSTPAGTETPSGTATGTPDGLEPRVLDGLGDGAFIDDVLAGAGTGSTARHRTVSVVFRTSNVIVTIVYAEQPALTTGVPDSKELQEKAQSLARKLVEQVSG
ncbi:DUF3558 domain-containing protein [Streptomyces lunaelactis]|uniref:DUF3558 domain-containing protein n=1 Tax=Streptomyces lunaelactis TaxID=1535768 RepID=UPI001584B303|nr:DUF3558 domain-containing protein [Streptomyces lunaelactis]NUL05234.1 DUF3558 domain-containing protein [Streptomyces lunaelactis]